MMLPPLKPKQEWTPAEIADHLSTVWIVHHVSDNGFPSAVEQMHYEEFINSGLSMVKYIEALITATLQQSQTREAQLQESESKLGWELAATHALLDESQTKEVLYRESLEEHRSFLVALQSRVMSRPLAVELQGSIAEFLTKHHGYEFEWDPERGHVIKGQAASTPPSTLSNLVEAAVEVSRAWGTVHFHATEETDKQRQEAIDRACFRLFQAVETHLKERKEG